MYDIRIFVTILLVDVYIFYKRKYMYYVYAYKYKLYVRKMHIFRVVCLNV
jgi:hypothetical protein